MSKSETLDPIAALQEGRSLDDVIANGPLGVDKTIRGRVNDLECRLDIACIEERTTRAEARSAAGMAQVISGPSRLNYAAESQRLLSEADDHQRNAIRLEREVLEAIPLRDNLVERYKELGRGLYMKRIIPAIFAISLSGGIVGSEVVMQLSDAQHDASIFSGDHTPRFLPRIPGISDTSSISTRVDYVPIEREAGPTTQYQIVISTDDKGAAANNEYAQDFKLKGTEVAADKIAATQFAKELTSALTQGGTISEVEFIGKASDEAAGESTGIRIANPQNEDLASLRAHAGEDAYNEVLSGSDLKDKLPSHTILSHEVILTEAEQSQLVAVAEQHNVTTGKLINSYNQNPRSLDLTTAEQQTMFTLFDQNRGVQYRATVTLPKEVAEANSTNTTTTSTKVVESSHATMFSSDNGEFSAGLYSLVLGVTLFTGALIGRMPERIIRRRARHALKHIPEN